jgi:hypothetical protein
VVYEVDTKTVQASLDEESMMVFSDTIALLSADITPVGGRRFRLSYTWLPLRPLSDEPLLFAVSRLQDVKHSRYPHLSTLALHATPSWSPDERVREDFEIILPDDLAAGTYQLVVGWYDSSHVEADATDERSRVGEEFLVGSLSLR